MPSSKPRLCGYIKNWTDKGYGFALMQDGRSVFVHVNALMQPEWKMPEYQPQLAGQSVELEVIQQPDGRVRGANVVVVEPDTEVENSNTETRNQS